MRVLMLAAAGTIEDRVDGLTLGADGYLPKPFAFAEPIARIRTLARRARPALPPVVVRAISDSTRRVAQRAGRQADPLSRVVEVTISRLRARLGDPTLIETVPTAGYRI